MVPSKYNAHFPEQTSIYPGEVRTVSSQLLLLNQTIQTLKTSKCQTSRVLRAKVAAALSSVEEQEWRRLLPIQMEEMQIPLLLETLQNLTLRMSQTLRRRSLETLLTSWGILLRV